MLLLNTGSVGGRSVDGSMQLNLIGRHRLIEPLHN
jgi:hypothetical protein